MGEEYVKHKLKIGGIKKGSLDAVAKVVAGILGKSEKSAGHWLSTGFPKTISGYTERSLCEIDLNKIRNAGGEARIEEYLVIERDKEEQKMKQDEIDAILKGATELKEEVKKTEEETKKEEFEVSIHITEDLAANLFNLEQEVIKANEKDANEAVKIAINDRLVVSCKTVEAQAEIVKLLNEKGITDIICKPPLPEEKTTITFTEESNKGPISQEEIDKLLKDMSGNQLAEQIVERMEVVAKEVVEAFMLEHKDEFKGDRGNDGSDGENGVDGKPGTNGTNGTNGTTPKKGVDYVDGKDGKSVPDWIIWVAGIGTVVFLLMAFIATPIWMKSWKDDAVNAAVKAATVITMPVQKQVQPSVQIKEVPSTPSQAQQQNSGGVQPSNYDNPQ